MVAFPFHSLSAGFSFLTFERRVPSWPFAAFLGGLASLGFAPFYFSPLYVVAFGLFIRGLHLQGSLRSAFKFSAGFVFCYLLSGHYWVVFALGVDWAKYWPIAIPVFVGIPLLFGWLYAVFALVWWQWLRSLPLSSIIFGICWWCAEQVKEHVFVGFPWNVPADVWTMNPNGVLQLASYLGAAGLGLLTIVGACWIGAWRPEEEKWSRAFVIFVGGALFLYEPERVSLTEKAVVLVQPSISQTIKTHPTHLFEIMERLKYHSQNPKPARGATIIWAEGAMPMAVKSEKPYGSDETTTRGLQEYFAKITQNRNTLFATAVTYRGEGRNRELFNSMLHVGVNGKVKNKVSKSRLLPFGEYIPFRWVLPKLLADLAAGPIDMSPDQGSSLLFADGLKWHVLICFESQFSDLGRRHRDADAILVVTNDSWFGNSSGPYQHFSASVLRAVETGKPVLRVANNGISGIVDGHGHRHAELAINAKETIHANVPQLLPNTFYMKQPYLGVGALLVLLLTSIFCARRRGYRV